MKVVSGTSNPALAANIAKFLKLDLVKTNISKFGNGEKRIWIKDNVEGSNIALVQSFSNPVDELIIETLLLADALERCGARKINLVLPWMGYSLQDKVFRRGEPIAAKVVADLLSHSFIKRIYLLDLHNKSIPGFFSVPTEYLSAIELFLDYAKKNFDITQAVVTSPDFGSLKESRLFAEKLSLELTNINKHRNLQSGKVTAEELHGEVKNKVVLLFDDVIMSGSTLIESAKLLKEQGAKAVYFMATHAVLADNAERELAKSAVDKVVVTNSIHHSKLNDKITVLDLAPVFAQALKKWL